MILLQIDNSESVISGLSNGQYMALRRLTSYTVDTGRKIRTKSGKFIMHKTRMNLMDKTGRFPTGLLYIVQHFLQKHNYKAEITDYRKKPNSPHLYINFLIKGVLPPAYPEQLEAAQAVVKHHRGIVVATTGVGKTRCAIEIILALKVKTLIVVPSLGLKEQLTEALRQIFGESAVGPLKRGKAESFITIENVDALDPKSKPKGVQCVIIDEFHHAASKTYRELNKKAWTDIYYRIGLTATPHRSDEDERLLLESVLSRVIYRVPYQTAVEKGYIVPMESYFYEIGASKAAAVGGNYHKAYSDHVINSKELTELIVDLAENLLLADKSTLILVKQVSHGKKIQDALAKRGHFVEFAEGVNKENSELVSSFNKLETRLLIGTSVLGEGIDTKPCEYVIDAAGGKSKNAFMQKLGRAFRVFPGKESCKIIMFRICGHKWFKSHFSECLKILKEEYASIPVKLSK